MKTFRECYDKGGRPGDLAERRPALSIWIMEDERRPGNRPRTVAERRFAEHAAELEGLDLASRFARIYETDLWAGAESRSGAGSGLDSTARLRIELPRL